MIKKYLITFFGKIKPPKNTKLIFENEFLKRFYKDDQLSNYQCVSLENLNQVYLKKDNYLFCKKKAARYLSEISPILNRLNNSKLKKKEWEILIEYFLIISVSNIKTRIDTLKKIKDKKNTFVYANDYNFFFENTSIFKIFQFENINFNSYISFLISKKLNLKILKSNRTKKIYLFEKLKKKTFFKRGIYFVYHTLMRPFKPIIILDGYFGKKKFT
tara:strand:- start:36 stop:683 length:648 start_codon:yes stop_codon:yes gene_type:complete